MTELSCDSMQSLLNKFLSIHQIMRYLFNNIMSNFYFVRFRYVCILYVIICARIFFLYRTICERIHSVVGELNALNTAETVATVKDEQETIEAPYS